MLIIAIGSGPFSVSGWYSKDPEVDYTPIDVEDVLYWVSNKYKKSIKSIDSIYAIENDCVKHHWRLEIDWDFNEYDNLVIIKHA
jgi:hypothetical protein